MKKIFTTYKDQPYTILVDDDDYSLLSRHKWHLLPSSKRMYAYAPIYVGEGLRKMMPMTHVIMGSWYHIDHIDNNSLNNQKENLRPATWQMNGWNKGMPKRKDRKSRFKGVRPAPLKTNPNRWQAYFKYVELGAHKSTGKMIWLGYFNSEVEAAKAYNEAIVKYRGEYAWLNPIPETTLPGDGK